LGFAGRFQMFQIKICGITTVDDALLAAEAGADAIGLNFYEKSSRFLRSHSAAEIARSVDGRLIRVGVFVNAPPQSIIAASHAAPLDAVQLHGDEPPQMLAEVAVGAGREISPTAMREMSVIRAIRVKGADLLPVVEYVGETLRRGFRPAAVLIDAYSASGYGGTGTITDWDAIGSQRERFQRIPLILAGGLTPENVAEAIAIARPDAVDVASGVESAPDKKDPAKVRDFVAAAKEAFAVIAKGQGPS
jgi:phosphoribosylanthranilate isomerase